MDDSTFTFSSREEPTKSVPELIEVTYDADVYKEYIVDESDNRIKGIRIKRVPRLVANEEKRKKYIQAPEDSYKFPKIKGYIAKHKWGGTTFFSAMPVRDEEAGAWVVYGACIQMDMAFLFEDAEFKELKWEDEPVPYEIILKKFEKNGKD